MRKLRRLFHARSIVFIITISCITVVLALAISLTIATYTSFRTSTREAVNAQTRELSSQIVYNYENYIGSVIETSNIIQTDVSQYDIQAHDAALDFSLYLAEIIHLKSDIAKIAIFDTSTGRCLTSSVPADRGLLQGSGSGWFKEAIADPTVHVFSVPYAAEHSGNLTVTFAKQIKLKDGVFGVLRIEISFQNFIELAEKSNLGEGGHVTIVDPAYQVVYTSLSNGQITQEEADVIRSIVLGSASKTLGNHSMAVNVDTLSNTKWRICVFSNMDHLDRVERNFLTTTLLVSLGILAIGVLIFFLVSRFITDPIKRLEQAMRNVEKSDYFRMEEVNLASSKEVEALAGRFNKMMVKIKELMDRVIAEQDAQRRSELKALQNQINPHFLYNTLDSIVWLIENGKNKEAGEMVVALARLFRIGISKDKEVISVREELEHVRNYLLIQSIRYPDSFDYIFETEPQALELPTLKLILQPIVENAIYHGLKHKIDRGLIHIRATIEDDFLVLSVRDNGYGMREETIQGIYDSFADAVETESVGLKNIYQRIRIFSGGKAQMLIESELDEGTIITIKEPIEP